MSSVLHRSRLAIACLAVLTPLATATAARADRGAVPHSGGDEPMMMQTSYVAQHVPCTERFIEHPFAAWDDNADYFLAKEGDFGGDAIYDWNLAGAELVAENNPSSLHGEQVSALALSQG